jgi:hypothetical protein
MSTIKVDTLVAADGSSAVTLTKQVAPKAWLNYKHKSTVSVRDSFNISSVTDSATGYGTANFSTNFGNDDYAPLVMGDGDSSSHHTSAATRATTGDANVTFTTSAHAYYMHNIGGTTIDAIYVTAQYIGDLA